jgi:EmrB/QacA subfamily drug resistance transporter
MQYKWTALTVTTIGILMTGLDSRILIIGLPTIAEQLHAGAEEVIWIGQSYLLASTVCLLLIGRLADLFGRVKLYSIGFMVFTAGSILSAVSLNSYQLISFRVIQGIGAAMLQANSTALVTDASPPKELGTMLGINQTALRVGAILGLTLSGLILSLTDWRGLFYVNIPIGIFGTLWAQLKLREISVRDPSKKMDWLGFALFSTALTLILLAITFLSYGTTGLIEGLSFLVTGVVLMLIFVIVQARVSYPMLDLGLFKIRLFMAGNLAQLLNSLVWSGLLILFAFFLQIGLGYSPLQAGVAIVPLEVAYVISSLISAKLSDRYGTRVLCTAGLSVITADFLLASTFSLTTQYPEVAVVLVVCGIGNGMFTPPNLRAIMGSVPNTRRGIASSFRQTMFNTGSTCGYGLVILFLTIGIPYGLLSPLIQSGAVHSSITLAARTEFLDGFRIACVLFAVLEGLAIFPSAMRGSVRESVSTSRSSVNLQEEEE